MSVFISFASNYMVTLNDSTGEVSSRSVTARMYRFISRFFDLPKDMQGWVVDPDGLLEIINLVLDCYDRDLIIHYAELSTAQRMGLTPLRIYDVDGNNWCWISPADEHEEAIVAISELPSLFGWDAILASKAS